LLRGPRVHLFPDISLFLWIEDARAARKIILRQWVRVFSGPEVAEKAVEFPVDFPFSGNFCGDNPCPDCLHRHAVCGLEILHGDDL
jgi:hypothetical protein